MGTTKANCVESHFPHRIFIDGTLNSPRLSVVNVYRLNDTNLVVHTATLRTSEEDEEKSNQLLIGL